MTTRFSFLIAGVVVLPLLAGSLQAQSLGDLEQFFDEKRGQLQVGGPFAGVEFHHGRPVPSRISLYYPVANSLDLSTDYWKRDDSKPVSVVITSDGRSDSLEALSARYRATPASAVFDLEVNGLDLKVEYRFAETSPYLVMMLTLTNPASRRRMAVVETSLDLTLRTSHTYSFRRPSRLSSRNSNATAVSSYNEVDTGPTSIFVASVGSKPDVASGVPDSTGTGPAKFTYSIALDPGQDAVIVHLIGSSRPDEVGPIVDRARSSWRDEISRYESRVVDHALAAPFESTDTSLVETARWSKALLQADRHWIDGHIAPMPCPAQYNFFFTHDLLLTDFGAVNFDQDRVRDDLTYLRSLTTSDSLLPHAYYWKDGAFVTEKAGSDNWNHFWFVLLASSYLKHSADIETIASLWPMLTRSIELMTENEHEGLMYAERPDWWDIGHVYGARSYTTMLAIRTLRAYGYLGRRMGFGNTRELGGYLALADSMQDRLSDVLWDDEVGYLLNRIEGDAIDRHYYSGSLLGAAFGLVDSLKTHRLLDTARRELLDPNIGIRNAMPPDFHRLTDLYRFQEGEVGDPYRYMNGGIWPQGIAWYVSGLAAANQSNEALAALKRYLTLDGIRESPNGQPAFFEYRHADPGSPDYGRIDKTTFLWAGGFYLNVLYQLLGVRSSEWNIALAPQHAEELEDVDFTLLIEGQSARVEMTGSGPFFQRIEVDGQESHSAVMTGPTRSVRLTRGKPLFPYLASASAIVESVTFDSRSSVLEMRLAGIPGQQVEAQIVSPTRPTEVRIDDDRRPDKLDTSSVVDGALTSSLRWRLQESEAVVRIHFRDRQIR